MNRNPSPATDRQLVTALEQMLGALQQLDDAGAPGEIGSGLDLAIARLEEHLGVDSGRGAIAGRLLCGPEPEPCTEGDPSIFRSARDAAPA